MKIRAVILLFILLIPSSKGMITAQYEISEYPVNQFWQTTLSAQLHLNKRQFKICQGAQTVGDDSYWLWSVFNATTVQEDGFWYNPSQHSSFPENYGLILSQSKVFPNTDSCSLNMAMQKYNDAQNCYAWDKTYSTLISELDSSEPMIITADTSFLEQNANGTFNESIQIKATFEHLIVFISYPLSQTNTLNSELKSYNPWFTPCLLMQAYRNTDYRILSPGNWECAFSSKGYLTGITKALIVAGKGTIAISVSCNSFETTSLTQITSPVMLGVLISGVTDYIR
jgi:hypothetical protein